MRAFESGNWHVVEGEVVSSDIAVEESTDYGSDSGEAEITVNYKQDIVYDYTVNGTSPFIPRQQNVVRRKRLLAPPTPSISNTCTVYLRRAIP